MNNENQLDFIQLLLNEFHNFKVSKKPEIIQLQ